MFNNPLLSDVTFIVRPSETQIREIRVPAHKYVLAISGPVFCAMFYGDIAKKNDSVHLPDCHANGFLEFLRFLYSDEVKLTADSVLEVLYLAKKYIVPHLATKCVEYLEKEMNYSNVFEILKYTRKFDEEDLVERCWQIIDNDTIDCIQSEAMLQIGHDILESLVKRDTLNIQEVELFKAAKRWAERKCSESDVEATGPEMRRVLRDALFHFRFLAMKPKEFTEHDAPTKICLDAEGLAILVFLITKPSTDTELLPFPKGPRSGLVGRLFKRVAALPLCKDWIYFCTWCEIHDDNQRVSGFWIELGYLPFGYSLVCRKKFDSILWSAGAAELWRHRITTDSNPTLSGVGA